VNSEVIDGAAALAAQDAGGVGVIDHHDGSVFFGGIAEAGQRANVAVHGEDAVRDQQLLSRLVLHARELLFGVGHILWRKTKIFARDSGSHR